MNYDLPFNVMQFYNAPIWPGKFDDRKSREVWQSVENNETYWSKSDEKYQHGSIKVEKHPADFSAGELYHSFENLLVR